MRKQDRCRVPWIILSTLDVKGAYISSIFHQLGTQARLSWWYIVGPIATFDDRTSSWCEPLGMCPQEKPLLTFPCLLALASYPPAAPCLWYGLIHAPRLDCSSERHLMMKSTHVRYASIDELLSFQRISSQALYSYMPAKTVIRHTLCRPG